MDIEGENVMALLESLRASSNTSDFELRGYDGSRLLIIGSFDLAYYHEVEIEFEGVSYIELPTSFNQPRLRVATAEESKRLRFLDLSPPEKLYVIESDADSDGQSFYIAAERVRARRCLVYHYRRENLQEGEEIADWVE
jgi:hypothetical protein